MDIHEAPEDKRSRSAPQTDSSDAFREELSGNRQAGGQSAGGDRNSGGLSGCSSEPDGSISWFRERQLDRLAPITHIDTLRAFGLSSKPVDALNDLASTVSSLNNAELDKFAKNLTAQPFGLGDKWSVDRNQDGKVNALEYSNNWLNKLVSRVLGPDVKISIQDGAVRAESNSLNNLLFRGYGSIHLGVEIKRP